MISPLDDGLQIRLDQLTGNLVDKAEGYSRSFFDLAEVRSLDGDLAIFHLVHLCRYHKLKPVRFGTAHLYPDLVFPDALPLIHGGHVQYNFFCHFHISILKIVEKVYFFSTAITSSTASW